MTFWPPRPHHLLLGQLIYFRQNQLWSRLQRATSAIGGGKMHAGVNSPVSSFPGEAQALAVTAGVEPAKWQNSEEAGPGETPPRRAGRA